MGVSEAVADYAIGVERSKPNPTTRQAVQLALLRLMPLYRNLCRLDLWEKALQDAWMDEHEEHTVDPVIDGIFEFGRLNLYTNFDEAKTQREHASLLSLLRANGIHPTQDHDVSDW